MSKMAGSLIFYLTFVIFLTAEATDLKLEQVLVLSRHNIRTPLTAQLESTSPHIWPKWEYDVGHLTKKGALLERYMGEYLAGWLSERGLLLDCPQPENLLIYANTKQRTRLSASSFVEGAFPNCNVTVHSIQSDDMDPVFNPILRPTSEEMLQKIENEMLQKINELELNDAYVELNEILNLKHSDKCKVEAFCNFLDGKDKILLLNGEEPNVVGPLAISNNAMDAFIMSYYEGMDDKDVAWGKIRTPEQWSLLTRIIKENQNVRFNSSTLAKVVAKPLLEYIRNVFSADTLRNVTILFGHDSNLNSVMAALGFKYFELPNQYEATPPGGKIIFQKWRDQEGGQNLLKINFIYQSTDQIRNATRLTTSNPPQWVQLELRDCGVDERGFCPWEKFKKILSALEL
ncbi:glucose-1-phosphatase-like [Battus philenor]|uniref:glucose-1-phosphatase-like n=1 Tax=Battus philenor TaxID=42288 RepID=UPI0035D079FA